MNTPLISVIVPVYNRADLIGETIESIMNQTHTNWELHLVDDGSTDDSVAVLKAYKKKDARISFSIRPDSMIKGANACRNLGLSLSRGKYVKWVDSDDILLSNALSLQRDVLEGDDILIGSFMQSRFFDSESHELQEPWSRRITSNDIRWDYVRNQIRWHTGGILWRRSAFVTPPFHEPLKNSQEWLMHGQQLWKLRPEQMRIDPTTIYHIRRGNVRMSSSRSARYYFNQALSRYLLLKDVLRANSRPGICFELAKQILIYSSHSVYRRFKK